MDEEHVRRLLMQIESGKRQMEQLNRQAQLMESAMAELNSTVDALNTLKGLKPGVEVLVQVGAGSYVRAALKDTENVLVGVGAEMSVEKGIPDAVEALESRKKQLNDSYSSVQKTIGEIAIKLGELNAQAEHMMGQERMQ
jgi:prefoldin alpha subunit